METLLRKTIITGISLAYSLTVLPDRTIFNNQSSNGIFKIDALLTPEETSGAVPLELDVPVQATIGDAGQRAVFSFTPDSNSNDNGIYTFSVNSDYETVAYLYDSNMNELYCSEDNTVNPQVKFVYALSNQTYYVSVSIKDQVTGDIEVIMCRPLGISSSGVRNFDTTIYENQAYLQEEIIDGETVWYYRYDYYPRTLEVVTSNGRYNGTLDEISEAMYQRTGLHFDYSVETNNQSYSNQWTSGGKYSAKLKYFGRSKTISSLVINEGPILSMDIDPVTRGSEYGETVTEYDENNEAHTYIKYDSTPANITAHTVDGDISGTEEEIIQQIKETYNITIHPYTTGDDQTYLNPWSIGSHEMTYHLGTKSFTYDVSVTDDISYVFQQFEWQSGEEITARAVYKLNDSSETIKYADASVAINDNHPATCLEDGYVNCTAFISAADSSDGETHEETTDIVLNALGHDYEVTYQWSEDNTSISATAICQRDNTHVVEETVNTEYAVITPSDRINEGEGEYTAVFTSPVFDTQKKRVIIPRLDPILAKRIDLNSKVMGVLIGDSSVLTANVVPRDTTFKDIIWESADPAIASVDDNGTVTGISTGNTTITAILVSNPEIKTECNVTVGSITDNKEEAILSIRRAWVARQDGITVWLRFDEVENESVETTVKNLNDGIFMAVLEHTGNPLEGSILASERIYTEREADYYQDENGYICKIQYDFGFFTTDEENEELKAAIDEILDSLDLENKSDYEKVRAIYDYITENVVYDYEHLRNGGNTIYHFLPYGALVLKCAVCEGISYGIYQLMLSAGIDCRVITGQTDVGLHAWNIVKLGDYYYDIDATWDLGNNKYEYFLKCDYNFNYHRRSVMNGYASEAFYAKYPMSPVDYDEEALWVEENNISNITIDDNTQSIIFEPAATGHYTFESIGSEHKAFIQPESMLYREKTEVDTYYVQNTETKLPEPVPNENTMNECDFSYTFSLKRGNRYVFKVGFEDNTQSGNIQFKITKNPFEPVSITSVTCDSVLWFTGLGKEITVQEDPETQPEIYMYYDPAPSSITVMMENGDVLQGSLDEVIEILTDRYEMDVDYSFDGNDQTVNEEWGVGVHDLMLHFNELIAQYSVIIEENPVKSVVVADLPYIYDNEYDHRSSNNYYYSFDLDAVTVLTDTKTYEGKYNEVYEEICSDYNYIFPNNNTVTPHYPLEEAPGNYTYPIRLFGIDTTVNAVILHNPVKSINAENRTVTENNRYLKEETIIDDNGNTQTVTYLSYPNTPQTITVTTEDGLTYTGTPEETEAYLQNNYNYYEVFEYSNCETYADRWKTGTHEVTVTLRNINSKYNIIVQRSIIQPLVLGTGIDASIDEEGMSAMFSYQPSVTNEIYTLTVNSDRDTVVYLYDSNMNMLYSSEDNKANPDFKIARTLQYNQLSYFEVLFKDGQPGDLEVILNTPFRISTIRNCSTDIYENQAYLQEEIIDGETVWYYRYDYYPRTLEVVTSNGRYNGTLDEISEAMYQRTGVHFDYSVETNNQSYNNQWTVGGKYSAKLNYFGRNLNITSLNINEGPILSMDIDPVTRGSEYGETVTEYDENNEAHTYIKKGH